MFVVSINAGAQVAILLILIVYEPDVVMRLVLGQVFVRDSAL